MGPEERRPGLDPRWGWLGVAFYGIHASALLATGDWPAVLWNRGLPALGTGGVSWGDWPSVFWSCHLAALLTAGGILYRRPRLVGVALCWSVLGLPLWFTALFSGTEDFYPTSTFTHIGALVLAFLSLRRTGMPRGSWWRASLSIVILWAFCQIALPDGTHINLSKGYWFEWEARYVSYLGSMVVVIVLASAVFRSVEGAMRRLARARPTSSS